MKDFLMFVLALVTLVFVVLCFSYPVGYTSFVIKQLFTDGWNDASHRFEAWETSKQQP